MEPLLLTRRSRPSAFPTVALSILLGLATVAAVCAFLAALWIRQVPTSFAPILADTGAIKSSLSSLQLLCLNIYSTVADIYATVLSTQALLTAPPGVDLSPIKVLRDAAYQYDQINGWVPGDPVLAVGPSGVLLPVNDFATLFDKETLTPTYKAEGYVWPNPGGPGGDGWTIYDERSKRFFYTTWNFEVVDAIVTVNGTDYDAAQSNYGPPEFDLSAPIVAAQPLKAAVHGVPTLNNAAACAGKIVLVEQGGGVLSYDKAHLVMSAGAVGMIFMLSSPGLGLLAPSDVRPTLPIPVVGVSYGTGVVLLANAGATVRMHNISGIVVNQVAIAVSKDSNPQTGDDFYVYQYFPDVPIIDDYPKFAVDGSSLYYVTQRFAGTAHTYVGTAIATFDKAALLAGPGGSTVAPTDVTVLANQGFAWPVVNRYPLTDLALPTFFVSWNDDQTGWRIFYSGVPFNGWPALADYVDVPFPEPFAFVGGTSDRQAVALQPAPGAPIEASLGPYSMSPVLVNGSIWLAMTLTPTNTSTIVRWVELDVSQFLSAFEITVKQWGDLNQLPGMNTYMPALNVDRDGNMLVVFTVSNERTNPTMAYTGRLASDPPGTIRFPYQTPIESAYSYSIVYPTTRVSYNRWGDYAGCVVDPSDGKTFYMTAQQPSQLWSDNDGQTSYTWTAAIVAAQIRQTAPGAAGAAATGPVPTPSVAWTAESHTVMTGLEAQDDGPGPL